MQSSKSKLAVLDGTRHNVEDELIKTVLLIVCPLK